MLLPADEGADSVKRQLCGSGRFEASDKRGSLCSACGC